MNLQLLVRDGGNEIETAKNKTTFSLQNMIESKD